PVFQGLAVGPYASGSAVGRIPSSGVFVLPTNTNPAARNLAARYVSSRSVHPRSFSSRIPSWNGSPAVWQIRSFRTRGTPRNGPSGRSGEDAASLALSNRGWITALSSGLTRSIRSMAASTSSFAVASPRRTSSACAVASSQARSSAMVRRTLPGTGLGKQRRLGVHRGSRKLARPRRTRRSTLSELTDMLRERARAGLPPVEGELRLGGLQEPVEVLWDPWGVPDIYARNTHDLYFTQGYVLASE